MQRCHHCGKPQTLILTPCRAGKLHRFTLSGFFAAQIRAKNEREANHV